MRIFLTGANGFIGANLARRFLTEGWGVTGLVRPTSDLTFLEGLPLETVRGDLEDVRALTRFAAGADVFLHAAGLASDWAPRRELIAANVRGAGNAALAAVRAGTPRFLNVSSAAIHGFSGYRDRREDDPVPPSPFPYVETKRKGEETVRKILSAGGPELVVLRPGNVFGPCDRVTMRPMLRAIEMGTFGVIDQGRHLTCPTYVENLAELVFRAATRTEAAGRTYLVTDGLEVTWREFVDELSHALGGRCPPLSVPQPFARRAAGFCEALWRAGGIWHPSPPLTLYRVANGGTDYHFSIERARRELGFVPRVDLAEACRRTVTWYREDRARIRP